MKSIVVGFSFLQILFGCASTTFPPKGHPITGPDGSENEVVSCSAIEQCYDYSRQICQGTYKIVNSTSEANSTGGKYPEVYSSFGVLVKCDSGKANYPVIAGTNQPVDPNAEFPNAHSFKDCEQYVAMYQDRCREEVVARNSKASR